MEEGNGPSHVSSMSPPSVKDTSKSSKAGGRHWKEGCALMEELGVARSLCTVGIDVGFEHSAGC